MKKQEKAKKAKANDRPPMLFPELYRESEKAFVFLSGGVLMEELLAFENGWRGCEHLLKKNGKLNEKA
jgi:hypothetical protein